MKIVTDLAFLDAFYHACCQPQGLTVSGAKARIIQGQFLHLLLAGATVHCADIGPNLQQYNNPLLLELNKLNRLRYMPIADFSTLTSIASVCRRSDIALFCLQNPTISNHIEASIQTGYYFLKDVPADDGLFVNQYVTYNRNLRKSWAFANGLFQPHHSIVIADAYLFNEYGESGLFALLGHIQPNCLGYPYWITLLGSDAERKKSYGLFQPEQIRKLISKIEALFDKAGISFEVEAFVYNGAEFHDRYILTNNLCVLPGYGISIVKNGVQTPQREGTWTVARPFSRVVYNEQPGVYFEKVMKEKLKTIKQWIEMGGSKVGNPFMIK